MPHYDCLSENIQNKICIILWEVACLYQLYILYNGLYNGPPSLWGLGMGTVPVVNMTRTQCLASMSWNCRALLLLFPGTCYLSPLTTTILRRASKFDLYQISGGELLMRFLWTFLPNFIRFLWTEGGQGGCSSNPHMHHRAKEKGWDGYGEGWMV